MRKNNVAAFLIISNKTNLNYCSCPGRGKFFLKSILTRKSLPNRMNHASVFLIFFYI